jgi:predicted  nucleic acid-binding Zn-ribbon protein
MLEQLSSLIELQRHDTAVDELQAKVMEFDPLIKKKTGELETLRNTLKTSKESLTANTLKKKQLEGEVEEQQKLVQKHNAELNSLKSNDAYKAMLGEIQGAKQKVTAIEDQILVVMEAIEANDRAYKEAEKKFKSDESALKADVQKLEDSKASAAAVVATRKAERDTFAKTVSATVVSQYEAVRNRSGGVAIVPMINNSCGGCHLSLTQNKINEVRKAKNVVMCEVCSRIIYLAPSATAAPAASPASAPTAAS